MNGCVFAISSSADRAQHVFEVLVVEGCEGDVLPRVHDPARLRRERPLPVRDDNRGSGQPEGGATSAPAPAAAGGDGGGRRGGFGEHGAGVLRQPLILQNAPANEQRARQKGVLTRSEFGYYDIKFPPLNLPRHPLLS